MPADITQLDGQDLVAVNATRGHPWHMLGTMVDKDMTMSEALTLVGVHNEEIRNKPLWVVADGATTRRYDDQKWIRVVDLEPVDPDVAVAVNSTKFGTISTASKGYHAIQRRHFLQLAYDFVGLADQEGKKGYVDTIGNLGKHGDTFFAYIRVPDIVIDPHGIHDVIEHGLFIATSYDSSLANTIGYSSIRPVCRNTVSMALGNLHQTIRVKHTRKSEERIKQMAVALQYVGAVEEEMTKRAEAMLRVDGDQAFQAIVDHFYDVSDKDLTKNARTQRNRARRKIEMLYNGPDNTTTELVGKNGYAAYQAFVEYKDHDTDAKGKGREKDLTRARNAVLPGKVVQEKIKASELVLSLN